MKQPKKLTRQQKITLSKLGYDPAKFMLESEENGAAVFINTETKERITVNA